MKKMLEVVIEKFEDLQEGDRYFNGNEKENPLMEITLTTKAETSFLIGTTQGRRRLSNDAVQGLFVSGTKFYGMREVEVPDEPKTEPKKPFDKNNRNGQKPNRNNNNGRFNDRKPQDRSGKLTEIAASDDDVAVTGKQLLGDLNNAPSTKEEALLVAA